MKKLLVSACLVCSALHLLWPRDASSHTPVTTHLRFNQEIAPLLNAKCAQCHIADGMAMALQTWAEARPWAVAIKEEILSHRMPPWPAQRGYGAFANDIGLTPLEQEFVTTWVDGGVPAGEGDPPLPFDHAEHWMLGEPDRTVTGRATANPIAAAPDGMVRAVIDPKLDRDTVIRGFDLKPGNKMVHAAFLSVVESGQYLGGWTPWSSSTQVPDGVAFKVPARSRIAVDMLYGSAAAPPSNSEIRLGLYFPKNPGVRAIADIVLRPSVTTAKAAFVPNSDCHAPVLCSPCTSTWAAEGARWN